MKKKIFKGLLILLIGLPLIMYIAWLLTPNTRFVVAIIDKTVPDEIAQEHVSLNWVLNHLKFTKTTREGYQLTRDYFGFFPGKDKKYEVKGLERFSFSKLDQLSSDADMAYFTDTYGIYKNEWFENDTRGVLYGGLSEEDLELMRLLKQKNKLIITEFNTIGSPTALNTRRKFEELFGLEWTGWTARYFDNLDQRKNKEIPEWLIRNYNASHANNWNFKRSGIAFVGPDYQVVILEEGDHLKNAMPHILTNEINQDKFGLPSSIKYPFWFDIISYDHRINEAISNFSLNLSLKGKQLLKEKGIPQFFPAVLSSKGTDYPFYYFSGDFADNPVSITSSYFKGINFFKELMYDTRHPMERGSFFWKYYQPLLTTILQEYQ